MENSVPQQSQVQIVVAQHLIPIEGERLSPGALAFQGGRILEVGSPEALRARFPEAEVREYPRHILLPGLVNAHADLSLTHFSKYPHPLPDTQEGRFLFTAWLINVSRFKAKLSIPDQQKAIAEGLEIVKRSGVTALGDVCRYPVAMPLYEASGLRVTVLAEIENIQRSLAQEEFEQALALIDEVERAGKPRLRAGLAPFSAFTISKNMLRILANHAVQLDIPFHLMAALAFSEMEFFYDSQGEVTSVLFQEAGWGPERIPPPHHMTPVQYLHEIGLLKARPALLGCLHLGPTDAAILGNANCERIYAPLSFEKLQVGEVDWPKALADGVSWALGTWGKASGTTLDLWDEMRAAFFGMEEKIPRQAAAQAILRAATLGGAKALRQEAEIGSLKKNKRADFLLVETPEAEDCLEAALLELTRPSRIAASFVEGLPIFS
ncbi:MAG: amidohydrolase family protein [bacterium]